MYYMHTKNISPTEFVRYDPFTLSLYQPTDQGQCHSWMFKNEPGVFQVPRKKWHRLKSMKIMRGSMSFWMKRLFLEIIYPTYGSDLLTIMRQLHKNIWSWYVVWWICWNFIVYVTRKGSGWTTQHNFRRQHPFSGFIFKNQQAMLVRWFDLNLISNT